MVYAALENWDDRINTWLPNTCPTDWYETSGVLNTLGSYLSSNYIKSNVIPQNTLPEYYNVIYKHKEELIGKTNYVYIVPIFDVLYFGNHKDLGFKTVDARILEDVRKGLCDIILIQDIEGMSGGIGGGGEFDFCILNDWVRESNLPGNKVHYLSANLHSKKVAEGIYGASYNTIPVTVQDIWVHIDNYPGPALEFNPRDDKYLFLSYSRRPRTMRVYFYSALVRDGLINKGTVSFNFLDLAPPYSQMHELDPKIRSPLLELYNMCPLLIDRENVSDDITLYMNLNDYESTFIFVVNETLHEENVLFHSEKIWKPIVTGHPFIILGNKGHLQWLKKQGFKTFDKWIDESYDMMDSMVDRCNAVTKELIRFSKMSVEELKVIRKEMFDTCNYNKQVMRKRIKQRYYINDRFERLLPQSLEIHRIFNQTVEDLKQKIPTLKSSLI